MLKGNHILRIGIILISISLLASHTIGFSEAFSSFCMGMGCGLTLVGTGERFSEARTD